MPDSEGVGAETELDLGQPRDLGAILRTCFRLYAHYFPTFATIALAVVIPVDLIVFGFGYGLLFSGYIEEPALGAVALAAVVPIVVTTPLITAMHVQAVQVIGQGRAPSVLEAMKVGLRVFVPVAFAIFITSLGVMGGTLLLIVPGIYLWVIWYVVPQAVVVDGRRATNALGRSSELVSGMWWRVLGIVLIFLIIIGIPGAIFQYFVDSAAKAADSGALMLFGNMLSDAAVYSFLALSGTILYFDLRARFEGRPPTDGLEQAKDT